MASENKYDLVVIGAGPGGYVGAIRAAQLGLKTLIIERDKPGGVCLNVGCIPSKALIQQAKVYHSLDKLAELGIKADLSHFDYSKVSGKAHDAAATLSEGIRFLLKKNKIDYVEGEVRTLRRDAVELQDGRVYEGAKLLIATGSRPRELQGFAFDGKRILSSTDALQLQALPKSLLILGSGAIGVEFAHLFNRFGVEVHLAEMLERILPNEDEESVTVLAKAFKKRGVQIYTSTKALSQQEKNGQTEVILEDHSGEQKALLVDQVLVSAGRIPNTDALDFADLGIELDKGGFIKVGDYFQTAAEAVYAIGDVLRSPMLAHVASKEAEIAVEHMVGKSPAASLDPLSIPACTYCEPQLASFGYSESAAEEAGIKYKKLSFPYRGIGKAVATDEAEGFIKILLDEQSDELIGAHIVGAEASELIHELLLVRTAELLPEDLIVMIHAHPTLAEGLMEAMRQALDGSIHS